jgi:hypothetical protein
LDDETKWSKGTIAVPQGFLFSHFGIDKWGSAAIMKNKQLSSKQVHSKVVRRLRSFDKLNHLECFAMFMGKAQLVEMALKHLLITKYGYTEQKIERWILGQLEQIPFDFTHSLRA